MILIVAISYSGFFGRLFFGSFVPAAKVASYFGIALSFHSSGSLYCSKYAIWLNFMDNPC